MPVLKLGFAEKDLSTNVAYTAFLVSMYYAFFNWGLTELLAHAIGVGKGSENFVKDYWMTVQMKYKAFKGSSKQSKFTKINHFYKKITGSGPL